VSGESRQRGSKGLLRRLLKWLVSLGQGVFLKVGVGAVSEYTKIKFFTAVLDGVGSMLRA
jgi:hypothetical protein